MRTCENCAYLETFPSYAPWREPNGYNCGYIKPFSKIVNTLNTCKNHKTEIELLKEERRNKILELINLDL